MQKFSTNPKLNTAVSLHRRGRGVRGPSNDLVLLNLYPYSILIMQINIIIFGQLCDLLGENLVLNNIADTDSLTAVLNERYPEMVDSKYVIAVNKKLVTRNTLLTNNSTVALLPPFSGG